MPRTPKQTRQRGIEESRDRSSSNGDRLISEVMTRHVDVVAPHAGVIEAAGKMKTGNIGAVPVCDGGRLIGMITDRDIAVKVVADRRNPAGITVREVMTHGVVYGYEDQGLEEIAKLMEDRQIRRLPILNRGKRLVGIVSLGDLAVWSDGHVSSEALAGVSQPERPTKNM